MLFHRQHRAEILGKMKIFISYAIEDLALVEPYYARLRAEGFDPWMVDKNLLPSQNRQVEIEKAFAGANVIMLFISSRGVDKSGLMRHEASHTINNLDALLATDCFVIPVFLEPCIVPLRLSTRLRQGCIQTQEDWMAMICSLRLAQAKQKELTEHGTRLGPFRVFTAKTKEAWTGRPGHDIEISYPRFESDSHPVAAMELTTLFSGRAIYEIFRTRQKPWRQMPGPDEGKKFWPSDARWDNFSIAHASSSLLSLVYTIGTYSAGGAQPNCSHETHNFLIDAERVIAITLPDLFAEDAPWLERLSLLCVAGLKRELWERQGKEVSTIERQWIERGADARIENFAAFTLSAGHISFLFAPFQVAAYELGSLRVDIPYYELRDLLRINTVFDGGRLESTTALTC